MTIKLNKTKDDFFFEKMADFSFISDQHTRSLVSNGYAAVNQLELLEWLKGFTPKPEEGFMWSSDPNIYLIGNKMESLPNPPGHSGSSFATTMRHLDYIAKNGLDQYKVFMATA
jgi:hypothetical protein